MNNYIATSEDHHQMNLLEGDPGLRE